MKNGGPHDLNLCPFDELVWGDEVPPGRQSWQIASLLPANFKVYDADAVTPLAKPLEEMVALVGAAVDPVRFLKDKDSHAAFHPSSTSLANTPRCL